MLDDTVLASVEYFEMLRGSSGCLYPDIPKAVSYAAVVTYSKKIFVFEWHWCAEQGIVLHTGV